MACHSLLIVLVEQVRLATRDVLQVGRHELVDGRAIHLRWIDILTGTQRIGRSALVVGLCPVVRGLRASNGLLVSRLRLIGGGIDARDALTLLRVYGGDKFAAIGLKGRCRRFFSSRIDRIIASKNLWWDRYCLRTLCGLAAHKLMLRALPLTCLCAIKEESAAWGAKLPFVHPHFSGGTTI